MRFRIRHAGTGLLKRLLLASVLAACIAADAYFVWDESRIAFAYKHENWSFLQPHYEQFNLGVVSAINVSQGFSTDCFVRSDLYIRRYVVACDSEDLSAGYVTFPDIEGAMNELSPDKSDAEMFLDSFSGKNDARLIDRLLSFRLAVTTEITGLWAPTARATTISLRIDARRDLSPAEIQLLRAEASTWLDTEWDDPADILLWSQALDADKSLRIRPILSGYLHNTLSLSLLATLLYTLASTPFALRRALRASAHACPHCAYDLAGIDADRCPECGALRST